MKSTGVVDSRAPLTRIGREHTFPLLGREWECERVERLLQTIGALGTPKASSTPVSATAAGVVDPPQSVLLTGEAGIGKTRLAEEWGTQAMRLGWYVFWSSGRPMLSGNPYQIWMEILRQALHLQITYPPEVYRALTLLEEGQDEAHGGPRGGDTQPPRRLGEQAHLRLWEAFCALLAHLAEHAPVLVILDDVGYSDSLSRDLFRYLTRQVRGRAIMLVGTMRSHEGQ